MLGSILQGTSRKLIHFCSFYLASFTLIDFLSVVIESYIRCLVELTACQFFSNGPNLDFVPLQ